MKFRITNKRILYPILFLLTIIVTQVQAGGHDIDKQNHESTVIFSQGHDLKKSGIIPAMAVPGIVTFPLSDDLWFLILLIPIYAVYLLIRNKRKLFN